MRRAKLNDVARRAGVSRSTASRALNGIGELSDETRDAVTRAAQDLHYRPSPLARTLRTRRSRTVGLVVPTVAHSFYAAVTNGAQRTLEEHGYRLILIELHPAALPFFGSSAPVLAKLLSSFGYQARRIDHSNSNATRRSAYGARQPRELVTPCLAGPL